MVMTTRSRARRQQQQQEQVNEPPKIMSDYISFDILQIIIKMLPVESLIRFRSVSKEWKSLIDSSEFIVAHTLTRRTNQQQHHMMFTYRDEHLDVRYVSVVDDDLVDNFPRCIPLWKILCDIPTFADTSRLVGTSHGLLCFFSTYDLGSDTSDDLGSDIAIMLNPSIRTYFEFLMPKVLNNCNNATHVRFGVRPSNLDPMIVYMRINSLQWQVEVFTLSSRTWRPPLCSTSSDVFFETSFFKNYQVVIGKFIYWLAHEGDIPSGGRHFLVSFDMDTEEFTKIIIPECFLYERDCFHVISISKLRGSLAVYDYNGSGSDFEIWVMEPVACSFSKQYSCKSPYSYRIKVLGLRKNGAPIVELEDDSPVVVVAAVSDPYLKHVSQIGVRVPGYPGSFRVHNYHETLLLL